MSRILVDGHGGDHAPGVVIEALAAIHAESADANDDGANKLTLGIVGQSDILLPALQQAGLAEVVQIVPASEIIGMSESPAMALRRKKDSSIHVGARQVRDGEWDALVSAGNTGALMVISKFILKTIPGVDRPAIASMLPAEGASGKTLLLDAGANVDSSSEHLTQFAIMGSCYMEAAEGIKSPRVGVLNIGSEDIKGT
ncbi:MAG: phosphate acyltransferase, partial [Mariprofundaceae bacterium]|nr:phosphate acyltransferase [Mariprofundaceae bacterium]